ncbi:MAG: type I DNA topoisomerase [Proteobacteria bacterium]|nr:type I DNA topoisomerase [Pseudomonadota bacterium]
MSQYVVVVESPAKAKTIEKYLGKQFKVMASYGHVRDLVPKEGAVDPEHDFAMKYQPIERNSKHVEAIAKAVKSSEGIYLAPDPDREGEAIAWHVLELLQQRGVIGDKPVSRVVFHEITKSSIKNAVEHPRQISLDLVNAQQARRALDYLVGFNLSPLLWRKIRPGLSAGRVQSPALRMIVEREEEIQNFISREYWSIHANLLEQEHSFTSHLIEYQGKKLEQFSVTDQKTADAITTHLTQVAQGKLLVTKVTKKARKKHPAAPFITSTLQQEAARKLGFTAQRTMQIAQQLYEGIELGEEGSVGLISYMRTDSVSLAWEAVNEIRDYIAQRFGPDFVPEKPRLYKSKSKNAQEAHEAIRPTSVLREPDQMKKFLTSEQLKLYTLIWKRTVACQMIDASIETISVDLAAGQEGLFRATGSTITDPGFINVYQEGWDDKKKEEEDMDKILPPLRAQQWVTLKNILGEQHFTEPPPRYTEATLVKGLEERDIGRPSTYASIIATLKNREYVNLENKRFIPTDVGKVVNRFLTQYFTQYVDYDFTARLEDDLDDIAKGDQIWVPVLKKFWGPFKNLVDETQHSVKRSDVTQEKTDEKCPDCGHPLVIRLGKRGRFFGCSHFPDCKYTRNLSDAAAAPSEQIVPDKKCPNCQGNLLIKQGPYGKFIGCSNYPECKFLEPIEKPKDTKVTCPKCTKGHILQRKSRRGKVFFSCSRYPECAYALWNEPVNEECPNCHWPILTIKVTKKKGREKLCPQPNCGFHESLPEE